MHNEKLSYLIITSTMVFLVLIRLRQMIIAGNLMSHFLFLFLWIPSLWFLTVLLSSSQPAS